jgi:hypothetical protein
MLSTGHGINLTNSELKQINVLNLVRQRSWVMTQIGKSEHNFVLCLGKSALELYDALGINYRTRDWTSDPKFLWIRRLLDVKAAAPLGQWLQFSEPSSIFPNIIKWQYLAEIEGFDGDLNTMRIAMKFRLSDCSLYNEGKALIIKDYGEHLLSGDISAEIVSQSVLKKVREYAIDTLGLTNGTEQSNRILEMVRCLKDARTPLNVRKRAGKFIGLICRRIAAKEIEFEKALPRIDRLHRRIKCAELRI